MTVLISALAFFFLITGLILIHEFGHFMAARWAGVKVEEFGFGLPPRAKKLFRWKGTLFSLNWVPFGGFVRLKGEGAEDKERLQRGSFAKASLLRRSIILVAGVVMNFLLAILIFLFGFSYGQWIPTYRSLEEMEEAALRKEISLRLGVIIDDVLLSGTANDAAIPAGSVLLSVDDVQVSHPEEVVLLQQGKKAVTYTYLPARDAVESRTAKVQVEDGKTGVYLRAIPLDISSPRRGIVHSFLLAMRETGVVTEQTVLGIGNLFSSLARHGVVPEGVTGIVGIAQLTYTSVQEGFMVYLRLVALLSLSLAVLNILPFPALDGGRLVFVCVEALFRRTHRRLEFVTNTVGFAVLIFVILLVTFYDVFRLFV